MYQVLYRKWRPKIFDDVVGQEHVTTTLKNELVSGRLNHAYLFTGSRGTGKTSCAKILSKAANCSNLQDGNPCGECECCVGIEKGTILDVVEMDAASNRRIDDIRTLIDEAQFTPSRGKYRVYIVDEVHMLTNEAFNALLKTLEEPPPHVLFILATTEVHKLPLTILSRCQRFDFFRIQPEEISRRITQVAEGEGVKISDEAVTLIAAISDGAMRDALSLMDRCVAAGGDITAETVRTAAGLAQKDYLFSLVNCIMNKNSANALEIIDKLYKESKDMARLCAELCSHFRTLMLIKSVKNPRQMLVLSDDEFEQACDQAKYVTLSDIVFYIDVLQKSYERMGKGTTNRTELETAVIKLASPELEFSSEAVFARIAALEKLVNTIKTAPAVTAQYVEKAIPPAESVGRDEPDSFVATEKTFEKKAPKPIASMPEIPKKKAHELDIESDANITERVHEDLSTVSDLPEAKTQPIGGVDSDALYENAVPFTQWPEVISNLRRYSKTIAAAFELTNAYISGNYLLIESETEIPFKLLRKSAQKDNIRLAVQEVTGKVYKLGPYKKPEKKQEAEQNPLEAFLDNARKNGIAVEIEE